jgi:hypothetical protein
MIYAYHLLLLDFIIRGEEAVLYASKNAIFEADIIAFDIQFHSTVYQRFILILRHLLHLFFLQNFFSQRALILNLSFQFELFS